MLVLSCAPASSSGSGLFGALGEIKQPNVVTASNQLQKKKKRSKLKSSESCMRGQCPSAPYRWQSIGYAGMAYANTYHI